MRGDKCGCSQDLVAVDQAIIINILGIVFFFCADFKPVLSRFSKAYILLG